MRTNVLLLLLLSALLPGTAGAKQDLVERAHQILIAAGLEDEWIPGELVIEETDFGAVKVKSERMTFAFGGPETTFISFLWYEKLDEIRKRSPGKGPYYRRVGDAGQRALEFVGALVSDPEKWRPTGAEEDMSDATVGNQMEYQGGAVTSKLERVINGLVVRGEQIAVTFDSFDGKVASIYVSTRKQDSFTNADGLMTPSQAQAKARDHATQHLRNTLGQERAAGFINAFLPPEQTVVSLGYGPLMDGFDSKYRDYTLQNRVPPVYTVYFGNVTLYIHAQTGDCLGGILDAESDAGANSLPIAPSPSDSASKGSGTQPADKGDPPKSDPRRIPTIVLSCVLGVAVVGAGVMLYFRRTH